MFVVVAVDDAPTFPLPEDLEGYWTFDQVHAPRPLAPLSQEVILGALTEGFTSALNEVGYPLGFTSEPLTTTRTLHSLHIQTQLQRDRNRTVS